MLSDAIPDISVVVPTRNSESTLAWTLLSLKSQAGAAVEIIAVDSDSTDRTRTICAAYEVPVINVPAGNMYAAINAGIRRSKAPWVTYLNSDDYVYADSFARSLSSARAVAADIAYGMCDYVDWRGRHIHTFRPAGSGLLAGLFQANVCPFPQQGSIFTREVFETAGGFSEDLRLSSDFALFRIAHRQGFRFCRVPPPSVGAFRIHPSQLSHSMAELAESERLTRQQPVSAGAVLRGYLSMAAWKACNLPAYAERILRAYQLTGRPKLLRTISPP